MCWEIFGGSEAEFLPNFPGRRFLSPPPGGADLARLSTGDFHPVPDENSRGPKIKGDKVYKKVF